MLNQLKESDSKRASVKGEGKLRDLPVPGIGLHSTLFTIATIRPRSLEPVIMPGDYPEPTIDKITSPFAGVKNKIRRRENRNRSVPTKTLCVSPIERERLKMLRRGMV